MQNSLFLCLLLFTFSLSGKAQTNWPPDKKLIDKPAPLFIGKTLDDETISLDKLKGKVVLLNFWSLSCGACFKELPELNEIVKKYSKQQFVLISIMNNSKEQLLEKFYVTNEGYKMKKPLYGNDKIDFQVVPNGKAIMEEYVEKLSFPRAIIIDKHGIVRLVWLGYSEKHDIPGEITTKGLLIEKIDELLSTN